MGVVWVYCGAIGKPTPCKCPRPTLSIQAPRRGNAAVASDTLRRGQKSRGTDLTNRVAAERSHRRALRRLRPPESACIFSQNPSRWQLVFGMKTRYKASLRASHNMRTILFLLCPLIACASSRGAEDQPKGDPQPLGLTKFDRTIIDAHEQGYPMSCIASSVEMLLKLLGQVPNSYRDLQLAWRNKSDGCWRDFNNKTFAGVTFRYHEGYSMDQLFESIDRELHAGRFVVVGLRSPGGTHSWVVYDEDTSGEFLAISKDRSRTIEERHVKEAIIRQQGSDLGTYEFPTSPMRLQSAPPRFQPGPPAFQP